MKDETYIIKGIHRYDFDRVLLKSADALNHNNDDTFYFTRIKHREERGDERMSATLYVEGRSTTGFDVRVKFDGTVVVVLPCWASMMDIRYCYHYLKTAGRLYRNGQMYNDADRAVKIKAEMIEDAWQRRYDNISQILQGDEIYPVRGVKRDYHLLPSLYSDKADAVQSVMYDFMRLQETDGLHEAKTERRHIAADEEQSVVRVIDNKQEVMVGECAYIGIIHDNNCKFLTPQQFFLLTESNRYVHRMDAVQCVVDVQPDEEWRQMYDRAQGILMENYRKTFILRWDTDISCHRLTDFEAGLDNFHDNYFYYNWSIWDHAKAHEGDRYYMIRTGAGRNGIVMRGTFLGQAYTDNDWSGRGRRVYYIDMCVEDMLHPELCPLLLTTDELAEALPDFDWQSGHSGVLLDDMTARRLDAIWAEYRTRLDDKIEEALRKSKYYANCIDEVVVRVDKSGARYKKYQDSDHEVGPCRDGDDEAFGDDTKVLQPITRNQYEKYGKTWIFRGDDSPSIVKLRKTGRGDRRDMK